MEQIQLQTAQCGSLDAHRVSSFWNPNDPLHKLTRVVFPAASVNLPARTAPCARIRTRLSNSHLRIPCNIHSLFSLSACPWVDLCSCHRLSFLHPARSRSRPGPTERNLEPRQPQLASCIRYAHVHQQPRPMDDVTVRDTLVYERVPPGQTAGGCMYVRFRDSRRIVFQIAAFRRW
jgi:hypothetical protein